MQRNLRAALMDTLVPGNRFIRQNVTEHTNYSGSPEMQEIEIVLAPYKRHPGQQQMYVAYRYPNAPRPVGYRSSMGDPYPGPDQVINNVVHGLAVDARKSVE